MYLKHIAIKNIGPISELNIKLPFTVEGNPKPIIIVGENGAGKTFLQSQIVDSLYEIGSNIFTDIRKENKYYKLSGGINLQSGCTNGFSILQYENSEKENIEYLDKVGKVEKEDLTNFIDTFNLASNNESGNQKLITTINNKNELSQEWVDGVHFYQPAYRYEEPMWKNDAFKDETRFKDTRNFSGILGKELEVISANNINKSYLLDLVLDKYLYHNNEVNNILWNSVNILLRAIKRKENIRFGVGKRGKYRVTIGEMNEEGDWIKDLLPSIDALSLGESILLNLFINIIRHGDTPPKKHDEISGIVAIDEIDVHLHSDLQNTVLPELIQMFPKVQFIITTHSPLFILGMKRVFGEDGFEMRNMPNGDVITTERFSEFENAYNILKNTEKFEKDLKDELRKADKPILCVEDEYYQIYQISYLKLNDIESNEDDFQEKFNSKAPFTIKTGKSAGGVAGLLRMKDFTLFNDKKIVGLFDFDKEGRENFYHLKKEKFWDEKNDGTLKEGYYKKRTDCENFHAMLLPIHDDIKNLASLEWGDFISYVEIENLLPKEFLTENEFVDTKTAPGDVQYLKVKDKVKKRLWKELFALEKEKFNNFIPLYSRVCELLGI